jgi:hypothetical protein
MDLPPVLDIEKLPKNQSVEQLKMDWKMEKGGRTL